jgi:hypothetical protein
MEEGFVKAKNHELNFDGEILQRGFWLYVWENKIREEFK